MTFIIFSIASDTSNHVNGFAILDSNNKEINALTNFSFQFFVVFKQLLHSFWTSYLF